jgi:hypothetical protein
MGILTLFQKLICCCICLHFFWFQGPPVASAASKRKKGDKNKGKSEMSSIGELLVIPFLSKFPIPSHGEDASSVAVQK